MPLKLYLKIFGYGLLLLVITMVLLFIISMVTNSKQSVNFWWTGEVIAILMTACSLLFSRRFHPTSTKQALTIGLIWSIMLAAILLIIAIPNHTTGIVFGQWSTYLVFIGVGIGPLLLKPKPTISNTN